jgi:Domain of unknown function (DUF4397)
MRLSGFLVIGVVVAAIGACNDDEITNTTPPPLAGVRFINAMPDTGPVDIRMIDQVEWSAFALSLAFRSGTEHQPTEATTRRLRVFPTSPAAAITSAFMLDTTLTFTANQNYTVLLTGSAKTNPKTIRFVALADAPPTPTDVALRAFNLGCAAGSIDLYLTRQATDPLPAQPVISNVAPMAASQYVTRAPDTLLFATVTNAGGNTAVAAAQGPRATVTSGARPAAGVNTAGTALSAFCFPRSVAGTSAPQTAGFLTPAVVYFVDRQPGG